MTPRRLPAIAAVIALAAGGASLLGTDTGTAAPSANPTAITQAQSSSQVASAAARKATKKPAKKAAKKVSQARKPAKAKRAAAPKAPTTAAGYAAMFDRVPVSQWGGADVSISTALPDGRRVWLYGDTMSARENGFVHSSAIVQTGGTLRVSRGGAQVIPNVASPTPGYKRIYWIETARTIGANTIRVQLAPTEVGTKSVWDFRRWDRRSMEADIVVDARGDVTFKRWVGWSEPADIAGDGEDFKVIGPNHFTYMEFVHDIRLSNGKWLKTVNQNWDDSFDNHRNKDGSFRFTDWRPMYRESATRTNPYHGH